MVYTLTCLNACWKNFSTGLQENYLMQIRYLYSQAGWWLEPEDTLEKLARMISGSHCFMAAIQENGVILGMGRAISDRASDAYIQDVMVRPEVRRQAIASAIVRAIVERLEKEGMAWIGLVAKPGTLSFYRAQGFMEMPGAIPMLRNK